MENLIKDMEKLVRDLADLQKKDVDLILTTNILRQISNLSKDDILIAWDMWMIIIHKIRDGVLPGHSPIFRIKAISHINVYLARMVAALVTRMDILSRKDKDLRQTYYAIVESAKETTIEIDSSILLVSA